MRTKRATNYNLHTDIVEYGLILTLFQIICPHPPCRHWALIDISFSVHTSLSQLQTDYKLQSKYSVLFSGFLVEL